MELLYSYMGFKCETKLFINFINSIFASGIIHIFSLVIKKTNPQNNNLGWITFLGGSSFGIWRYATEQEVYIPPIFFSILGFYFLLLYFENPKKHLLLISSFYLSLACLFHQLQFWWWLSVFLYFTYKKKWHQLLLFTAPAWIVPITYISILIYQERPLTPNQFLHFVLEDYFSSKADIKTNHLALPLTVIGIIRSFIQIHGMIVFLGKKHIILFIPIIIQIITGIYFGAENWRKLKTITLDPFKSICIIALISTTIFSFLSDGNAEFLICYPLLLLMISENVVSDSNWFKYFSISIFIWNLTYSILPNNLIETDDRKFLIEEYESNQSALFVLNNKALIENEVYYKTGIEPSPRLALISDKPENIASTIDSIEKYIKNKKPVFSNHQDIYFSINRRILEKTNLFESTIQKKYSILPHKSHNYFNGTTVLCQITAKDTTLRNGDFK